MSRDTDKVFKALADATRRELLDRLRAVNGQTLGELCERLDMSRQAVSQHLGVLEAANLVSVVRAGRRKLHYLNPVPLHEMQERWIDRFERPRLRALSDVKHTAEEAVSSTDHPADGRPAFVYVTYIEATPERVWGALTDADLTAAYWGHSNVSDWRPGSAWEHRRTDGSGVADVVGTVVVNERPTRLVTTWAAPRGPTGTRSSEEAASRVTFDIRPHGGVVRLTVTHENLADARERAQAAAGWAAVLSNLKSFLETGSPLPLEPWLVPDDQPGGAG